MNDKVNGANTVTRRNFGFNYNYDGISSPTAAFWYNFFTHKNVQGGARVTLGLIEVAGGYTMITVTGGGLTLNGTYFMARGIDEVIAGLREIAGQKGVRSGLENALDTVTGNQNVTDATLFVTDLGVDLHAGYKIAIKRIPKEAAGSAGRESAEITVEKVTKKGDNAFVVPRSASGRIAYGSSDLSQIAQQARRQTGTFSARNAAVVEYRAADGSLRTMTTFSERGVGHAERLLAKDLDALGVKPSQVTRIYTELEPCSVPGGYCKDFINRTYPNAKVTYSFEYGADVSSRRAGIDALREAAGQLGNAGN